MVKYRTFFAWMIVISLMAGSVSLISPVLISFWGRQSSELGVDKVMLLTGVLLLVWALQMVFVYMRERFAVHFNVENLERGMELFYGAKYEYICKTGPSNILERLVQAVNATYMFMTGDAIRIWSSLFVVAAVLVLAFIQNYLIALMLLAIVPINYFGFKILNSILVKKSVHMQGQVAASLQSILSVMAQTDYLKQLGDYDMVRSFVRRPATDAYKSMADVNVVAQTASGAISSFNEIVKTVVMILAVYSYLEKEASPYMLVLLSTLLPIFFSNVSFITNANLGRKDMIASQKFLNSMSENKERDGVEDVGEIETIRYEMKRVEVGGAPLKCRLEDTFAKGDVVWLSGASGTGKSTLMKYLLKFYETSDIFINGKEISRFTNRSLRSKVCYCSQQAPIIKGTLRENLFFGREYSSEAEAQMLETEIGRQLLENKTVTSMIDENGANLSGGEKQKLVALRMAFQSADVLVLDEVTSSVDSETAKEIYRLFLRDASDRITFIISHDDSPKDIAHKVVSIMREGRDESA